MSDRTFRVAPQGRDDTDLSPPTPVPSQLPSAVFLSCFKSKFSFDVAVKCQPIYEKPSSADPREKSVRNKMEMEIFEKTEEKVECKDVQDPLNSY